MTRQGSSVFSRRLLIASVVFGLFVLCDILLFGWLIFRSLSEREVNRALLTTRAEAKDLAGRIAKSGDLASKELAGDLYLIMTKDREVLRYLNSGLAQRDAVEEVEVYNQDGALVWRDSIAKSPDGLREPGPAELPSGTLHLPPGDLSSKAEDRHEVVEAIGNLGTLRIGLSPVKLRERAATLRRDLIRQMVWILFVSLLVLLSAYALILLSLNRARKLEAEAQEADRLAYLGTLAAGLAHEIRNPLNSLNLNMQMLEEEMRESGGMPTGGRLLGITRQEISRLERLVTDFLLYAKPRPPEMREVAPSDLLVRAKEVLSGELAARGARLDIDDQSGGARLTVDPGQIVQLLLNLAQNALAATEESGRPPRLVLAARRRGNRLLIAVEDNGVGIPVADQRRVFELFYSTRKGGTGLGLAVVERIARAHGGEIELESTPGVGTTVGVALPLANLPEAVSLDRRLGSAASA